MAEAKKPNKGGGKPKGGAPAEKPAPRLEMEILFWACFAAVLIFVIFPAILKFFGFDPTPAIPWSGILFDLGRFYVNAFDTLTFISVFLTFLFILGMVYAKFKLNNVNKFYEAALENEGKGRTPRMPGAASSMFPANLPGVTYSPQVEATPPEPDPRWIQIQENMRSSNPSDWRAAIIEADIVLFEMLDAIGYEGETIAEKLKEADPANFVNLDSAWRAHKVRNSIAHEGASYQLGRTEAERTIALYERVFKEFYFV